MGAKTFEAFRGDCNVSCQDVRTASEPVLAHRVMTNFAAEADGVTSMDVIRKIIETIPEPSGK